MATALKIPKALKALRSTARDRVRRIKKGGFAADNSLQQQVGDADAALAALPDHSLILYIEAVRVKHNRGIGNGEVYSAGWMISGDAKKDGWTTGIQEGVGDGDLITYPAGGMRLARIKNPKEYVRWGIVVYESDQKARDFAADLQAALNSNKVADAIGDIAAAAGAGEDVASTVRTATNAFSNLFLDLLKKNGDDQLFYLEGSGDDFAAFGAHDPGDSETVDQTWARVRYRLNLIEE